MPILLIPRSMEDDGPYVGTRGAWFSVFGLLWLGHAEAVVGASPPAGGGDSTILPHKPLWEAGMNAGVGGFIG